LKAKKKDMKQEKASKKKGERKFVARAAVDVNEYMNHHVLHGAENYLKPYTRAICKTAATAPTCDYAY
jgi:hypothetical protein